MSQKAKRPAALVAFLAIGIAFIAIGISNNKAFIAIGCSFIVIGLAEIARHRKSAQEDTSSEETNND